MGEEEIQSNANKSRGDKSKRKIIQQQKQIKKLL